MADDTAVDDAAADASAEETEEETTPVDPAREAFVAAMGEALAAAGSDMVESHIGVTETWVRVPRDSWVEAVGAARNAMGCTWLDYIAGIDWLPSPFGRDMDSEQDWVVHGREENEPEEMQHGYAGGATRFQVMCRVANVSSGAAVIIKADLPDDDVSLPTLIPVFPGANWHEREMWEMYGIDITGHPDLRVLYLPSGFEGNPMRKDYPLLARRVKPWPGIVDVEQMPGEDDDSDGSDA